jgi:hypothetical protein
MRNVTLFISLAVGALLLAGCGWKSDGTVDMSRLMELDDVWEKREELVGQVVTLEFDTVSSWSSCCGGTLEINGRMDFKTAYFFTLPEGPRHESGKHWEDSIIRTRDTLVSQEQILFGQLLPDNAMPCLPAGRVRVSYRAS